MARKLWQPIAVPIPATERLFQKRGGVRHAANGPFLDTPAPDRPLTFHSLTTAHLPPPAPSSRRVAGSGVPIAGPPHRRTSASVAKSCEEICFHVTGRRRPCATREVRLPEICRLPEPWEPLNYRVTQQVYATAWDGNVVVQADLAGNFSPPTTFRGAASPRDRRPFRFLRRPWRGR